MSETKAPSWLRVVDVVFGLVAVFASVVVLVNTGLAVLTLVLILSFALLIHGISRVVSGGFGKIFLGLLRGLLVVVGLVGIVLSVTVLVFPTVGVYTLAFMLSVVFLADGIGRIARGITRIERS